MAHRYQLSGQQAAEQPVGPLIKQLSDQTRRLAQEEIELAKGELAIKAKAAGVALGLIAVAGLLGLLALFVVTAALVLALSTALAAWLAALIVAALYVVIAAVLGLIGRARLARATPLAPMQAVESVKEDVTWLKNQLKLART
ncbi:MAG: phage holin family protein [Solirubrobacteraceae bacterium]